MSIIAQICGALSLLFLVCSYLSKDKNTYFKHQLVANIFYGLQYLLLNALTGFITQIVSIVKTFEFGREQKKYNKTSIISLIIFEVLYIATGFLSFSNPISLIPVIISLGYTWASWQPNLKITCIAGILAGLLWFIYNLNVSAYVALISSVIESFSGLIGLIKHIKAGKEGYNLDI